MYPVETVTPTVIKINCDCLRDDPNCKHSQWIVPCPKCGQVARSINKHGPYLCHNEWCRYEFMAMVDGWYKDGEQGCLKEFPKT
jgi:hypothetical protein